MATPLLEARGIKRRFGHLRALDGADFSVYRGEICALIGDNGAGKSTLVKILSGADRPDEGQILLNGQPVAFNSPTAAQAKGIATVYQDLALAAELTPFENLFLGREGAARACSAGLASSTGLACGGRQPNSSRGSA